MIPRKQSASTEDFTRALAAIPTTYDPARLERLEQVAVARIRDLDLGPLAYCWSGGKDSVALGHVAEMAGVSDCMLGICNLEYPEFLTWATDHMPPELEIVNTKHDLAWLSRNQDMLFPQSANTASKWFRLIQHAAQRSYARRRGVGALLLGRRWADGNYTGKNGDWRYRNREGIMRVSPIFDWTHEDVLAAIHYRGLPLAPCYAWPRGFRVGTGPWPARQWCESIEEGWREVYSIDSEIVLEAARVLPSAREFLERI